MSVGQDLFLGRKGRGSRWKGGPLECGAPESGRRALSGGVWVGFRPSALERVSEVVSECRGGAWALHGRRGPGWAEDQAQEPNRLQGARVGRGDLATLPFDPLPSQRSPNFPFRVWDPFPSPRHPLGAPILSHLRFSSRLTPPTSYRSLRVPPVPLGVHGPPSVPGRCSSCEETQIPPPPSRPS